MDSKEILEKLGWVKKIDEQGEFYTLKTKTIRFIKIPLVLAEAESYVTNLTKEEVNTLIIDMASINAESN
jgi:hypothetical protein